MRDLRSERGLRRSIATRGLGLELEQVSLHREGRCILDAVAWSLHPGERWVLLGENGAGKTQLLKLLSGAVWPDADCRHGRRYLWHGRPVPLGDAAPRIAYLGPERQDRHERHDWNFSALEVVGTGLTRSDIPQGALSARQRRAALAGLAEFRLERLAERRFLECSFGERRVILLARAFATKPRWLLLDELLAGLDARYRARVLRGLAAHPQANSWVLSTHRLEEIPRSATHLAVLEQGRLVEAGVLPIRRRTVRLRGANPPTGVTRVLASRSISNRAHSPLVACEQVDVYLDYRPVLRGINFAIRPGECWVVHGANGAGKSTLLRALYGDHPPALGGRIVRRGIGPGVPLEESRRWYAIVAPHLQSSPPSQTVLDTVVSGLRGSIGLDGAPDARETRRALTMLRDFGLETLAREPLRSLSYGQVRRVLFARAWVIRPYLLLLDEAFAGIDAPTRQGLRQRVEEFVARGGAAILTSHHRDEWPRNTGHELELHRGRPRYCGPCRPTRG